MRLTGSHHSRSSRFGKPRLRSPGRLPLPTNMTEIIADMAPEKRVNALLSQVGRTITAATGADGNIRQFKTSLATGVSAVISVATLQITD